MLVKWFPQQEKSLLQVFHLYKKIQNYWKSFVYKGYVSMTYPVMHISMHEYLAQVSVHQ